MRTFATVEKAVKIAADVMEANFIIVDTDSLRNRVYSWYSHSDVTDPEILAACALQGKDWFPGASYEDMLLAKEWWFPANPYEEISIWEIEAAQHDSIWQ